MSTAFATERPAVAQPGLSYDSRRQLAHVKPLWRGWLHLICFEAALVVGTLLVVSAHGAARTSAAAIYAASVAGLFGTSGLYHRGNWRPAVWRVLQRLDHAMIFILIAGTATPLFLLVVPDPVGTVMLAVLWTLTAAALAVHLLWMSAPEVLVGGTYIALGCLGIAALPFALTRAGAAVFTLLLLGGALYILGAVLYHLRRPDPRPTVFGFHEVFHSFVCLAAAAQYVAVALVVLQ